jgi:hypothetical protein
MALTMATKLRQPKRVPSHFIDFDFIVLVFFAETIGVNPQSTRRFLWRQYQYKPFLLQNTERKGYLFPQQNIAEHVE